MCGIVGYIGNNQAAPFLLDGMSKLEYRGYDSAGIAVYEKGKITVEKCVGRLDSLLSKTGRKICPKVLWVLAIPRGDSWPSVRPQLPPAY